MWACGGPLSSDRRSAPKHAGTLHDHARLRRRGLHRRSDSRPAAAALPPGQDSCWRRRPQQRAHADGAERRARSWPVTGFTTAHFTAKVQSITGLPDGDYTPRQAVYDLKKLRAKNLITKVGRSRRYQLMPPSMRAVTALLVLRQHVIAPLLAGARIPPRASKPTTWTLVDQHYQQLRLDMQPLFQQLGMAA